MFLYGASPPLEFNNYIIRFYCKHAGAKRHIIPCTWT